MLTVQPEEEKETRKVLTLFLSTWQKATHIMSTDFPKEIVNHMTLPRIMRLGNVVPSYEATS